MNTDYDDEMGYSPEAQKAGCYDDEDENSSYAREYGNEVDEYGN
jgi:hypothetical protein